MRSRWISLTGGALILVLLASIALIQTERSARSVTPPRATTNQQNPPSLIPSFDRVFLIMMENEAYDEIVNSPNAPFINQLAATYALATNYYAVGHPSLPNYLALVSGSTLGMTSDCDTCSFNARSLADQLDEHQKSWGVYAEDLPSPCSNAAFAGSPLAVQGLAGYVRRHNPLMYFDNINQSQARCRKIGPLDQFAKDLQQNQLPVFVWITPNLQHDMHGGSIQQGDQWLASFVPPILASQAWTENSLLFLIWDEGKGDGSCCGNASGGQVPAIVVASQGKRGYQSAVAYSHYSVLRTIEDAWQLGYLDQAGAPGTASMTDFFP